MSETIMPIGSIIFLGHEEVLKPPSPAQRTPQHGKWGSGRAQPESLSYPGVY